MGKRIDASCADVGIMVEVPVGVKERVRVASLSCSVPQIMHQRVGAGGADVGIAIKIPVGIEKWVGVPALRGAMQ
jgi:hypothetical protein